MTRSARSRLAALLLLLLGACSQPTDVYLGADDAVPAPPPALQDVQPAPQPAMSDPPPVMVQMPPAGGGLGDAGTPVPELGEPFQYDAGAPPADAALADVVDAGPPPPLDCASGTADCDGDRSNGCETDTDTDLQNCGGCARLCHTMGHDAITATCAAGRCELTCRNDGIGDTDCDGDPDNGCETKTYTDTNNCGMCGRVCNVCFNGLCF